MEELKDKLLRIRKEKNLSQTYVAKAAGIKQPSYASIEAGDTKNVSLSVAKGLAKALGVSFIELFEIEDPEYERIKLIKSMSKDDRDALEFYRTLFLVAQYFEVLNLELFLKYFPDYADKKLSTQAFNLDSIVRFTQRFKEKSVDEIQKYVNIEKYRDSHIDSFLEKSLIIRYIEREQAKLQLG